MKILVTGATGFIGHHVVNWLVNNTQHEIIATGTNKEKAKSYNWFSKVSFIPCDYFSDDRNYYDYFGNPDLLIHLAWKGLPNYMEQFHIDENLPIEKRFTQSFAKSGNCKIVVIGTCYEYGIVNGCITEDHETNPTTRYAQAKNELRQYLQNELSQEYHIHWNWIRLFFLYGEGQSAKSLLPQLDTAIANGDEEFPMSGGMQVRDYLPVEKVAEYITKIALSDTDGIVNCCSGTPITVKELVENHIHEKKSTIKPKLGVYGYPTYEGMEFWGDNTKLMEIVKIMAHKPDFVDKCYKDNDLSLLKKLTLVIPTYKRTFYLSRCLWYHAHFPFRQIIVADSSPEEIKTVNRETVQKIRERFERDILYLEYEPETETYGGDIYRKWWDAVAHVNTEFSQVCTDKEFVIPTVSCMGINYLNENPEYICAFGSRLEFIKAIIRKKYVAPSCTQSYDEERAIDRMGKLVVCHSIPENMFQLYRSDVKKLLNKIISDSGINDIRYGEIATELQPLVYGKVKQFNVPGRVRDLLASRSGALQKINRAESSCLRYPSLVDYPANKKEQLHKQFIQCLTKTKPQTDNSDIIEINEVTKNIIDYWMGTRFDKFSFRCKAFIYKQLPDPIRKFLAYTEKTKFTNSSDKKIVKNELKIIKKIILDSTPYYQFE